VDEEFHGAAMNFIDRAHAADKPFFVWYNATRMHVWTRLRPEAVGRTGIGLYPDGMVEHDDMVGRVLAKLDELGIAENTIVIYSTDNGAESFTWPDGGVTPFHGEKGTTWEGGFRVPLVVRWPGLIEPGTVYNNIISQEDWMPTLLHAAGVPGIQEKLMQGYTANGKDWRVHLDGYDFLPFFEGEDDESPRDEIVYFSQGGELNAVRYRNWKVHFAMQTGNIATSTREVTGWPAIVNLRADPYEEMMFEAEMGYLRWYADNMWIFVPIQTVIKEFLTTIPDYPFQEGSSLNAAGINYGTLKQMKAMERLQELETLARPNN
jgi:arylsulfatase